MTTLTIPDEILKAAGIDQREVLIEAACRFFDAGKLTLSQASELAGLDRVEMENALHSRGIAIYRPTPDDVRTDLETIKSLKR